MGLNSRHARLQTWRRVVTAIGAILVPAAAAAATAVEPCTGNACTEWIATSRGNERLLVYRTLSFGQRNDNVKRALVVIHGTNRDADNYFRTATAAALPAGALEDTLIVAPRFASNNGKRCRDALAPGEINWTCAGAASWRAGGIAADNAALTSFDLADGLLAALAAKQRFPNLGLIVVAGHSAGGQFVTRYAMANRIHESLGVPVTYVVANPSSYAYLDGNRPAESGGAFQPPPQTAHCPGYDDWPYGLRNRAGYAARVSDDALKTRFASRKVTYLLGELDIQPTNNFDASCAAMAQGPHRLARGLAFATYATANHRAPHRFQVVPLCGHNARCMFTAEAARQSLFPGP